jgi:DNA repair protein RadC
MLDEQSILPGLNNWGQSRTPNEQPAGRNGNAFQSGIEGEASKRGHAGHRQRLRARFLAGGADALADYELLEMLLFLAVPRGDVKPLAKTLIKRFGSFGQVVSASPERLSEVDGVGPAALAALKTVQACSLRLLAHKAKEKPVIGNWESLLAYCQGAMAYETIEQFRVLYLDKKNRLIGDEVLQQGTIDHTPVYPREVARRAIETGASAVIMAHNHPSGDPTPSAADIEMTSQIEAALATLNIALHDHVVIGGQDHASFRNLGLL